VASTATSRSEAHQQSIKIGREMPTYVRASDADRDKVATVLREAMVEGRLNLDELNERLNTVYEAKTYAELEPAIRDLPDTSRAGPAIVPGGMDLPRRSVGFMGGFSRKGNWLVPGRFTALAFWGGGVLDLRKARFTERETKIRAVAIMGGMTVIVPLNAEVHISGVGVMGGFDHGATGPGQPGAPKILISGLAMWGGIGVRRRSALRRPR
jgi:Domain of unknown function (DUF1707)